MSNSFAKELKRNKYSIVVFFIFLILFIIGWIVFGFVMPKNNGEQYGNRLDSIKAEYGDLEAAQKASNEAGEKIAEEVKKKGFVNDASIDVKGKIINIIVQVKSGTSSNTAKGLSEVVLSATPDKIKKLYDLQLFITNEKDGTKDFPIIGYKNSKDKGFAF